MMILWFACWDGKMPDKKNTKSFSIEDVLSEEDKQKLDEARRHKEEIEDEKHITKSVNKEEEDQNTAKNPGEKD